MNKSLLANNMKDEPKPSKFLLILLQIALLTLWQIYLATIGAEAETTPRLFSVVNTS